MKFIVGLFLVLFLNECFGALQITPTIEPFQNPIKEKTRITLTGILNDQWNQCDWFRSSPNPFCTVYSGSWDTCRNVAANTTYTPGGSSMTCSLTLEEAVSDYSGIWTLTMRKNSENISHDFNLTISRQPEVLLIRQDSNSEETLVGTRNYYECISFNGVPKSDKFKWTIDDSEDFLTDENWHAFTYPVQYNGYSNVSQVLSLIAPSVIGNHSLRCEATTFEYDYIVDANYTIRVIEVQVQKLSTEWIIVIILAVLMFCLIVLIVICAVSFCFKCCCFKGKKKDQNRNNVSRSNVKTSVNPTAPVVDQRKTANINESSFDYPTKNSSPNIQSRTSAFTVLDRLNTQDQNSYQKQSPAFDSTTFSRPQRQNLTTGRYQENLATPNARFVPPKNQQFLRISPNNANIPENGSFV